MDCSASFGFRTETFLARFNPHRASFGWRQEDKLLFQFVLQPMQKKNREAWSPFVQATTTCCAIEKIRENFDISRGGTWLLFQKCCCMTNWSAKKSSATQRSSFVLFDLSRGRMAEFSMTYSNERHHHYCSACAKVWGPPIDFFWRRRIVHEHLLVPLCLLFIEQSQHYFLVLFWRLKAWECYKSPDFPMHFVHTWHALWISSLSCLAGRELLPWRECEKGENFWAKSNMTTLASLHT